MADRYCRNCGHELQTEDQFCANCGRPVQETAAVPTPEADVPVPPPPQQAQPSYVPPQAPQMQTAPRGPLWGMLAVFLVLGIGGTVQGMPAMPAALAGKNIGYQLGSLAGTGVTGLFFGIASLIPPAALILLLGGVYYATGRKQGVTFREAVFNWPLVIVAAIVTFVLLL